MTENTFYYEAGNPRRRGYADMLSRECGYELVKLPCAHFDYETCQEEGEWPHNDKRVDGTRYTCNDCGASEWVPAPVIMDLSPIPALGLANWEPFRDARWSEAGR